MCAFNYVFLLRKYVKCTRLWKNKSGVAAIEFAILAPLFILFLLGMIAYGIYFGASHSVQQLAADAARSAIAGQSAVERQTIVSNFINANAGGYPFIDPSRLTVSAQDSADDANQFDVALSYDARHLPIWNLLPDLHMPAATIAFHSTIRVGGI